MIDVDPPFQTHRFILIHTNARACIHAHTVTHTQSERQIDRQTSTAHAKNGKKMKIKCSLYAKKNENKLNMWKLRYTSEVLV